MTAELFFLLNNTKTVVGVEVPKANNDKTSSYDEVYFNTKAWLYICTQSKLARINWSSPCRYSSPVRVMTVLQTVGLNRPKVEEGKTAENTVKGCDYLSKESTICSFAL